MMIQDGLSPYHDKGIKAITELIKMTNIEEVKAHGLRLIDGLGAFTKGLFYVDAAISK